MVQTLLPRLVALSCRRPWWSLITGVSFALLAIIYAQGHFVISSDASELISPKVDWRAAEHHMDSAFPASGDTTLVVIDGATPELAELGATRMAQALRQDKQHVERATRPDGGDFFAKEGLLFSSPAKVQAATGEMVKAQPFLGPLASDPSLRGVADMLSTALRGVSQGDAKLADIQPALEGLGKALAAEQAGKPAFFSWLRLFGGDDKGALAAPTRRLVLVHPVLDYGALMPGEASSDAIRATAAKLGLDPVHGVRVRLTGSVPLSDEEFSSLADHWWVVAGAMVLAMLTTLWFATKSLRITGAILATTILGLIVTAALGLVLVGKLNLISVAFIPLFVGLGVDFGIQLSVRFQAERHAGAEPAAAIEAAAAALGGALLLAAGAVCLGFLAFLPTAYLGIAELGLIASIGMVVALLFSLTLLPALLMLIRPVRPRAEVGNPALAPMDAFLIHRRKLVLMLFGVSLAASVARLPFVRFDFNPLHLRAPDGEAMATLNDLMSDPDRNPNTVDILAPDIATAKALAARLERIPEVLHVITAESFVPDEQQAKLAIIGNANALLDFTLNPFAPASPPSDSETVSALTNAAQALRQAALGARPAGQSALRLAEQFDRLAHGSPHDRARAADMVATPLSVMLDQLRNSLAAQPVDLKGLPPEITQDWIARDGLAKVQVVPKAAFADNRGLAQFTRAVLKVAPDASGTAVSIQGAARTISGAFVEAGVLALVVVSLLLLIALRDVKEVAFTLAPVVLSGFLTLGTCVLIGQPINFANIIAFPLLFGVGVAFHIYFVMAWRAGATDLLQSSLARAIFFSAMATGTAFGSLWLSHHPGTASMGKLLMLSLVWTLICALIFEPALLGPPRCKEPA